MIGVWMLSVWVLFSLRFLFVCRVVMCRHWYGLPWVEVVPDAICGNVGLLGLVCGFGFC